MLIKFCLKKICIYLWPPVVSPPDLPKVGPLPEGGRVLGERPGRGGRRGSRGGGGGRGGELVAREVMVGEAAVCDDVGGGGGGGGGDGARPAVGKLGLGALLEKEKKVNSMLYLS